MYHSLKTINWSKLRYNNKNWHLSDEFDLYIKGDDQHPSPAHLQMAQEVIGDIEAVSGRAIEFLKMFLKLEGTWELNTLDFGCCFSNAKYDFEFTFDFEDRSNKYEYVYTYFVVSFDIQELGGERLYKPQRMEIGFR